MKPSNIKFLCFLPLYDPPGVMQHPSFTPGDPPEPKSNQEYQQDNQIWLSFDTMGKEKNSYLKTIFLLFFLPGHPPEMVHHLLRDLLLSQKYHQDNLICISLFSPG